MEADDLWRLVTTCDNLCQLGKNWGPRQLRYWLICQILKSVTDRQKTEWLPRSLLERHAPLKTQESLDFHFHFVILTRTPWNLITDWSMKIRSRTISGIFSLYLIFSFLLLLSIANSYFDWQDGLMFVTSL